MKKFGLILGVVLLMAFASFLAATFSGCSGTLTNPAATPAEVVQDKVCNAPPEVLAVADIILSLLKPELAALVPGSAPFVAYITAENIKTTGCAAVTGLNTMIAFAQGYNTKVMMAKAPAKELIPVGPLLNWKSNVGK